jgi:hypothetical protein
VLWNRLAERGTALASPGRWRELEGLAASLHRRDQVPFYRRLVVAEALPAAAAALPLAAAASSHG